MVSLCRYACACLLLLLTTACADSSPFPVSVAEGIPHGQLLLNLAASPHHGVFRRAEPLFDFAPDGAGTFLVDGWSAPETDGELSFSWAVSQRARLQLSVLDLSARWLHIRTRPFVREPEAPQTLSVRLNGVDVGTIELPPGDFQVHSLELPADALTIGDNLFSFQFAHVGSPPDDPRELAAAFDYVAITPDRDPPTRTHRTPRTHTYDPANQTIRLPAASELIVRVTLPPEAATVEFGMATEPTPGSSPSGEVALRRATPEGVEEEVFFRAADGDDTTTWRADLSAWGSRDVELVFRATSGTPEDSIVWRQPRLYGDVGAMNVRTNVVFIVIDTLRADYLGIYGGEANTPNIDGLARSGVLFERAYSHAPITLPSHSSMFTSLIPTEHAALINGSVLAPDHVTLAEQMLASYRTTAGVVSLGVLKQDFGVAQGFLEYHDDFGRNWWKTAGEINELVLPWLERHQDQPFFLWVHYSDPHEPYASPDGTYPPLTARGPGIVDTELTADGNTVSLAGDWPPGTTRVTLSSTTGEHPLRISNLRMTGDKTSVACTAGCEEERPNPTTISYGTNLPATLSVENPRDAAVSASLLFRASERLSNYNLRIRYREEVEYVDREIGRLLDAIDQTAGSDTLIVLTADHGEELGVHGPPGHVNYLYDSVLRVPLMMRWPERLPQGTIVADPVAHIDLLPTFMELLKISDTTGRSGHTLVPLIDETHSGLASPIVAETFQPEAPKDRSALVADGFKLIVTPEDDLAELYDLDHDAGEQTNLAREAQDTTARLNELLLNRLAEAQARATAPEESTLTEEQLERLRSLGYVR